MLHTLSEAINIQLPYNFERLLFYLTHGNHELVKEWMTCVDETAQLDLNSEWLCRLQQDFDSARITDERMCEVLKAVAEHYDYVPCPHTSVAFAAAEELGYFSSDNNKAKSKKNAVTSNNQQRRHHDVAAVALLATASPCKFEEAVTIALGKDGWNRYYERDFPERAKAIMTKAEVPPTIYYRYRNKGETLEVVQKEWEELARAIVAELQQ
jgi:threonine synthase